jgi:hypothetical protein
MEHGWPQGFAVSIMRRVRLDLEREHAPILQQCPDKLSISKRYAQEPAPAISQSTIRTRCFSP